MRALLPLRRKDAPLAQSPASHPGAERAKSIPPKSLDSRSELPCRQTSRGLFTAARIAGSNARPKCARRTHHAYAEPSLEGAPAAPRAGARRANARALRAGSAALRSVLAAALGSAGRLLETSRHGGDLAPPL